MDPVRGSASSPVTTSVAGGAGAGTITTVRPDGPAGTTPTDVYRGVSGQSAGRGDWPEIPDPGQGPGFGEATVDRCAAEIAKLEAELDKLGDGPEAMAKAMKLQRKLDTYTRIMTLISEIWKSTSDAIKACINNIN